MAETTNELDAGSDKPAPKKGLLDEAKDRYKAAESAWSHNVARWREDAVFRGGDQWPADILKDREADKRPHLVVDKIEQYVKQVVNDGRQNRPSIKIRPVEGGDVKTAEAFQGLIRDICDRSNADQATDTALEHAAACGFGFFRVLTEYASEGGFELDIKVRRIRNPLAVTLDPNIQEADGSDACFGFIAEDVPHDKFKEQYPKAKFVDWQTDKSAYQDGWGDEKNIRIAEYFYKLKEDTTLHLLADGSIVSAEEYKKAVEAQGKDAVPKIDQTRAIPVYRVKWAKFTGAEVLEERDWPGKYIPIIPVFGNELDVDGKVTYSGLYRKAKDAQKLYNFSRTAYAERVALTPKAPFIAAAEAVDGHEEWETANTKAHSVLKYDAYDENGNQLPIPQRQQASDIPEGFARDMQISEHDIQAAVGMYSASLGAPSNEKSGKAIMARQREGDTSTFHYQDNLNRAICYLGRILVDLVPKVVDTKRAIRILGEDGKATEAIADPMHQGPPKKINGLMVYNLGAGRYDVTVTAGPSYTTKRQEAAEAMIELAGRDPTVWMTHGDLIAKHQDWPGAEEWAKRSRLSMPAELREAIEAEEDESIPPEARSYVARAQQAVAAKDHEMQGMAEILQKLEQENQMLKLQNANKSGELEVKQNDSETKAFAAATDRLEKVAPALTPESIVPIIQQAVASALKTPLPAPEGGAPVAEGTMPGAEAAPAPFATRLDVDEMLQVVADFVKQQVADAQGQSQQALQEAMAQQQAPAPIAMRKLPDGSYEIQKGGKTLRSVRTPDGAITLQ